MREKLLRHTLTVLLKLLFRVEVRGMEHYEAVRGKRAVVIANHQSFLDPMLLAVFLPEKPAFAMNVFQAKKWYFQPLLKLVEVFTVDPLQPMSTKSLIRCLKQDRKVVVFPEGRITTSGGIMKVYEGTGMIIDRTRATVLPVRVEGAQHSLLSRLRGKTWRSPFPKITLTFLPPRELDLPEEAKGRRRRQLSTQRIYDMLTDAAFHAAHWHQPLLGAVLEGGRHAGRRKIATDITRAELSYRALWTRTFVLAGKLGPGIGNKKNVALLLPTSLAGMVTFLALHVLKRVPALLNFSAGTRNVLHACKVADVEYVLTSRAFVEKGRLTSLVEALEAECAVIYLEDIREQITWSDKLRAFGKAFFAEDALHECIAAQDPDGPAAILFTSGSEGMPKGVALSHANILSNIAQAEALLSFTEADMMLNAMPMFHSFGLTAGTLLPLVLGIRVYCYPSPLHYRVIPEVCYDQGATILLGTDTFYNGYARYAHPYDFHTVRLAVAGAEKLKEKTRRLYAERYGVNIYEGYGVTETAPVLAVNTPIERKAGTVGRFLPGIEWKLEEVEGLERGGRLFVKGPNVMLGYLKADQPGVIQPDSEWYDTGDVVEVDAQGYIAILGRAKRFAKIGGEMVSLAAVEEFALKIWPEVTHAALAIPDERKGEVIILLTEGKDATRETFLSRAREEGVPEIMFPRRVEVVEEIPRLGSGKIDYMALKEQFAEAKRQTG